MISEMKFAATLNPKGEVLSNAMPVSAFIWMCMNVALQKSVVLQIPHYVNVQSETHSKKLQFVKSNCHSNNNKTTTKVIEGGQFPVGESYGLIEITHFCYYCIEHYQDTDIPEYLYKVVTMKEIQPDAIRNLWIVHVCIIPSLETCWLVIKYIISLNTMVRTYVTVEISQKSYGCAIKKQPCNIKTHGYESLAQGGSTTRRPLDKR